MPKTTKQEHTGSVGGCFNPESFHLFHPLRSLHIMKRVNRKLWIKDARNDDKMKT